MGLGNRRNIPSTWKFMLLAQIVAISFATNLFLLAVLVSPQNPATPSPIKKLDPNFMTNAKSDAKPDSRADSNPKKVDGDGLISFLCLQFLILPGLESAAVLLTVSGTPSFMTTLLIPHLLLFVSPVIFELASKLSFSKGLNEAMTRENEKLYTTIVVASSVVIGVSTYSAATQVSGWSGILKALYEHLAISSVGWDIICCGLSWGVWIAFNSSAMFD
jgi:hypothetical protein